MLETILKPKVEGLYLPFWRNSWSRKNLSQQREWLWISLLAEEEPMGDTLFSIDVYGNLGDIYADDFYLIYNTREDNYKLASQILMFNVAWILSSRITYYSPNLFNMYVDPFNLSILWEITTFYEL